MPKIRLFLDDHRDPAEVGLGGEWMVVRTADEAIGILRSRHVEIASLDHDLGHCGSCEGCDGYRSPCGCRCHLTGYFVVCWMETEQVWPLGGVHVHSRNPSGAAKMRAAIRRHYERRFDY